MKKFLAILLSMGMVFSLVACGGSADSDDAEREESKEVVESTVEEVEETTETEETIEESTESVEVENEEVTFVSHPAKEGYVVGDYWYFEADATENGETKWFVYDLVADEIIGESDILGYQDVQDNRTYELSVIDGKTMKDVCSGETLLSLNENQEFCTWDARDWFFEDGYVLVYENQETFEGNYWSIGMVNHKGEWVIPLTSMDVLGVSIKNYEDFYYGVMQHMGSFGDGKFVFANKVLLDGSKGEIIPLESLGSYIRVLGVNGDEVFYICETEDGRYYANWVKCCSYNIATGETQEMLYDNSYGYGNVAYGMDTIDSDLDNEEDCKDVYAFQNNARHLCIANETGIIAEFDLSGYVDGFDNLSVNLYRTVGDKLLFSAENDGGTEFVCLMNTDGSMEFEPIKISEFPSITSGTEEKLVSWNSEGAVFVYNTTTKELVNTEMPYVVKSYIPEKDMFIVGGEHPEYGAGFYLVSTDDLETLINPFEK